MQTTQEATERMETRAMTIGMAGNLLMGVAGVVAAYLSNSQAILLDGLFSLIGFTAAALGKRVARNAHRGPDKHRPYGYAGDEAIFATFRSLSLLGLVLFAMVSAALAILAHIAGAPPKPLIFEPMVAYFALIGTTCAGLWAYHRRSWRRSGGQSEVLRLEAQAAGFDGLITGAAGAGLLAIHLLRDGPLAAVAPVGDSIIVLALCATVLAQYARDFRAGLGELAGVTAAPRLIAQVRRAIRASLQADGGVLCDLSVSKLGRHYSVMLYYDPGRPVTAAAIDALTRRLQADLAPDLPHSEIFVVVSEHGRVLPPDPGAAATATARQTAAAAPPRGTGRPRRSGKSRAPH